MNNKTIELTTSHIKFDIIGALIKVSRPEEFLTNTVINTLRHLVATGEIEHLLCYINAYKIAKTLSSNFGLECGIVEGYSCDTRINRHFFIPCWHVINYLMYHGRLYYFDLTTLVYPDQASSCFYAVRRYSYDIAKTLVTTYGRPFPTHIVSVCNSDNSLFYYNNSGIRVDITNRPYNVFDVEPFLKKLCYVVYSSKHAHRAIEYLGDIMDYHPFRSSDLLAA